MSVPSQSAFCRMYDAAVERGHKVGVEHDPDTQLLRIVIDGARSNTHIASKWVPVEKLPGEASSLMRELA